MICSVRLIGELRGSLVYVMIFVYAASYMGFVFYVTLTGEVPTGGQRSAKDRRPHRSF